MQFVDGGEELRREKSLKLKCSAYRLVGFAWMGPAKRVEREESGQKCVRERKIRQGEQARSKRGFSDNGHVQHLGSTDPSHRPQCVTSPDSSLKSRMAEWLVKHVIRGNHNHGSIEYAQ